ncbi:aminotransferase [Segnochrobactrum spirostomi]|uniref:aspartate transaminase n=1 Tax=Segnochrobactrum spirostomi TaxID=2608987 RepID=A0A6A7Y848_9HYPH|nr:aminotransferase [Segnochrobactrum spirostomi]MQT14171.1 aminotransferase [Segnochrobactrum spirostomi]
MTFTFTPNPVFSGLPTTIFEEMSQLARHHQAINLGQGFPDDPGPEDVRRKAAEAVIDGNNQYPSMMGTPELRAAIAAHYGRHHGVALDPDKEVLVTSGATEALAASILGLVSPGDEVVVFEPAYDAYLPLIRQAGGVPRIVRLTPPHWRFDEALLEAAIGPKTRVVIINNPINPAGAVWPREDLDLLARVIAPTSAVVVADEVWEHVVFDGHAHVPVLAVEGLRERSVKIGSAGKIFALTGWKVGLVAAAPPLLRAVAKTHQFLAFTTAPNLQAAVAYGLGKDDAYFAGMRARLQAQRDYFSKGLVDAGFSVLPSQGTYFVCVDLAPLGLADDAAFCRRLVAEARVAAVPVSAFYSVNAVTTVARFCFAKNEATLDEAIARLSKAVSLLAA